MIAVYSIDGKTVVELLTIEEYLERTKDARFSEYVNVTML